MPDDSDVFPPDSEPSPPSPEERAAWRKDEEREHLTVFLSARGHVTGEVMKVISEGESPDFVVRRASGSRAGIELARVYFNPPDPNAAERDYDWSQDRRIVAEIYALISSKAEKRASRTSGWRYRLQTILVLTLMDVPLGDIAPSLGGIAIEDCEESGFREIWVADMDPDAIDAFGGDIRLYGLFPPKWRGFHERRMPYRKPWG